MKRYRLTELRATGPRLLPLLGARCRNARLNAARRRAAGPPLSARERIALLEEAGGACALCRRPLTLGRMEVDHVQAVARGGRTEPGNLRAGSAEG